MKRERGKSEGELFVVPSERHVERLAREGLRSETRTSLRARLVAAFLPDVAFVDPRECRLLLGIALSDDAARVADDALVGELSKRGGRAWSRTVDGLDAAIGVLRAKGIDVDDLARVAETARGTVAARARTLLMTMQALDRKLASLGTKSGGVRDARLAPSLLAAAIARGSVDVLHDVLGANRLSSRWIVAWEPSDLAWVRAIDDLLGRYGGYARIGLPGFDKPLESARERDPLETLADDVARRMEAPPEIEIVPSALGDLSFAEISVDATQTLDASRVRTVRVDHAAAQARVVAGIVARALARGVPVEAVTIALPAWDERTLAPLVRALDEEGIVAHEDRGALPSDAPAVRVALDALEVSQTLERVAVAKLLGSGYVDVRRLVSEDVSSHDARASLHRLMTRLTATATASGDDTKTRFVRTATSSASAASLSERDRVRATLDTTLAEKLAAVLSIPSSATTRSERVRAAREVWAALGIGAQAGRGGLETFASDDAPTSIRRASILAIARDARAWNDLASALDDYEAMVLRTGEDAHPVDEDVFRNELTFLLDGRARRPAAGRVGAVRVTSLEEATGEAHALLVVLDANDGLLPRDEPRRAFVSDALFSAVARVRFEAARDEAFASEPRGSFVPPLAFERRVRDLASLALAVAEAEELWFVSTREDAEGALVMPSPVVTNLERSGIRETPASACFDARLEHSVDASLLQRASREREREGFFLDPKRPCTDVVGRIDPPSDARALLVDATGGGARPLAVTAIERFASCAFMGYAHSVLSVREPVEQGELPDAREEGNLVHAALAAAFVATRDAWPRSPRDETSILETGLAAADATLATSNTHAPLRAIARLRVRESVRAVLRAAVADDDWNFESAEQVFGGSSEGTWPAHEIEERGEYLRLRGSIDRVDRARRTVTSEETGPSVRVVDYKRSKSKVEQMLRALGETALQVPLYACVARRATGVSATGVYLPFQPRDVFDAKMTASATERMNALVSPVAGAGLAPVETRVLDLAVQVRDGGLLPLPATESACTYCAVSGGCRRPRFAMPPREDDDDEVSA